MIMFVNDSITSSRQSFLAIVNGMRLAASRNASTGSPSHIDKRAERERRIAGDAELHHRPVQAPDDRQDDEQQDPAAIEREVFQRECAYARGGRRPR